MARKRAADPVAHSAGQQAVKRIEQTIEGFAEDLGRLLGTARAKAEGWIGQRQNIASQLADIRDTASDLLGQLTGAGAKTKTARRRRAGGSARKTSGSATGTRRRRRKLSAAARKAISDAQKRRWAKHKAAKKQ